MICPSCQHPNENTASFCNQCGYPLAVSAPSGTDPSSPAGEAARSDIPSDPSLDATQDHAPIQPQTPQSSSQISQPLAGPSITGGRQGLPIAVIAGTSAVVAVVGIGMLSFFLTRPPQQQATDSPQETSSPITNPSITPTTSVTPEDTPTATSRSVLPPPSPRADLATNKDITVANYKVWRVIDADGLNCRSGPGSSNPVQKTFPQGQELAINAKYDNPIHSDAGGKPWLAIGQPGLDCFVRANESLIAAVPNRATPESNIVSKENCPSDTTFTFFAETKGFYINICESGVSNDLYYVGSAKNGSGNITLKIDEFDEYGYYASNGRVKYFLDLVDRKLVVTQADKTLLNENFINSD